MEIIFKKIVERILEVKKDLSIYAFAKELGLQQASLDRYVKGQRKPSVELIYTICQRFGVSSDWLLGLTESQQPGVTAVKSSVAIGAGAVAGAVAGNCASCPLMLAASKVVSGKRK